MDDPKVGHGRAPSNPKGVTIRTSADDDPKRRRGLRRVTGAVGLFGSISTVDAYAKSNPVDFVEIIADIYGIDDPWGQ
jgi:hypothetical protein